MDSYFASLAGQKLKNMGITRPPQDLTDRLSKVWLGQNMAENTRTILQKYLYSQQVLEEVVMEGDRGEYRMLRGTAGSPQPFDLAGGVMSEPMQMSNSIPDEDKDFVMLDKNDPSDGSVINIGLPKDYMLQGFKRPKNQPYTIYGPQDNELFLGTFEEGLQEILAYGDQNAPDETLNFENGLMYAMAYNNAPEAKTNKRDDYLMDYEEKTGISFDFETTTANDGKPEAKSVRYDPKNYNESDVKKDTGRCASYVEGLLALWDCNYKRNL